MISYAGTGISVPLFELALQVTVPSTFEPSFHFLFSIDKSVYRQT